MKQLNFWLVMMLIFITASIHAFWAIEMHKKELTEIQNYQITIDSLINKNQRLNDGFIRLYDDWSEVQVENDNLTRDNKYLKRITR